MLSCGVPWWHMDIHCATHTLSLRVWVKASLYVTVFSLSTLAPLSSSSSTTSFQPNWLAIYSAVPPCYYIIERICINTVIIIQWSNTCTLVLCMHINVTVVRLVLKPLILWRRRKGQIHIICNSQLSWGECLQHKIVATRCTCTRYTNICLWSHCCYEEIHCYHSL